jgi:hypothetical protein
MPGGQNRHLLLACDGMVACCWLIFFYSLVFSCFVILLLLLFSGVDLQYHIGAVVIAAGLQNAMTNSNANKSLPDIAALFSVYVPVSGWKKTGFLGCGTEVPIVYSVPHWRANHPIDAIGAVENIKVINIEVRERTTTKKTMLCDCYTPRHGELNRICLLPLFFDLCSPVRHSDQLQLCRGHGSCEPSLR